MEPRGRTLMATYSDPMLGYADYHSTGRYFALGVAASALTGASLVYASTGHMQALVHTSVELALAATAGWTLLGFSLLMTMVVLGAPLFFRCSKQMNDLLKRYRVCSSSQRDAILLAAARVENQSWPEARNARAGGVADARIDNTI